MSSSDVTRRALLSRMVPIPMSSIDENLDAVLLEQLQYKYEGKCIAEGYVINNSISISTRDAGQVQGLTVRFNVAFVCDICLPVVDMVFDCISKTVTNTAGIRAELDMQPSPLVVYLARDHHQGNQAYNEIKVGTKLKVQVIGQRFELNDPYISVIGKLVAV